MNKCEWRKGRFYPCAGFEPTSNYDSETVYCLYCDVDIREPEPELIHELQEPKK